MASHADVAATFFSFGAPVLLIHSDTPTRNRLVTSLLQAGIPAHGVASVADVEQWPVGEVVIAEERFFTPFWQRVGASHVFVLTSDASAFCGDTVSGIPATAPPDAVVAAVSSFLLVAA